MNKQDGITLISLIITIIIMLILAGVSLSMVMGDGSMLEQANAAADKTRIADVQEVVDLATAGNKMAKYSKMGLKSKNTLLTVMADQGLITDAEKTAVLAGSDLEINGTKIEFIELETAYQAAIDAGVTEEGVEAVIPEEEKVTITLSTSNISSASFVTFREENGMVYADESQTYVIEARRGDTVSFEDLLYIPSGWKNISYPRTLEDFRTNGTHNTGANTWELPRTLLSYTFGNEGFSTSTNAQLGEGVTSIVATEDVTMYPIND